MNGLVATFMGRPVNGGGTSGYHLHFSLWDERRRQRDGGSRRARSGSPIRLAGSSAASSSTRAG